MGNGSSAIPRGSRIDGAVRIYMPKTRLIARLDIKGPNLIKGIHLEGLRVMGDPQVYAQKYYAEGVDEIIYIDSVASLYGRNSLHDIISRAVRKVFIPITVGGGIRSVQDAAEMLRAGADKVAINTAAVHRPELITEIARRFGSQCVTLSIQAKANGRGGWEVYTENGREHSGLDVVEWAKRTQDLGAGEILLTSVDREGTQKGFDLDLLRAVGGVLNIPLVASGGMGTLQHMEEAIVATKTDAVAIASVLHYGKHSLSDIRAYALARGLNVREL